MKLLRPKSYFIDGGKRETSFHALIAEDVTFSSLSRVYNRNQECRMVYWPVINDYIK